MSVQPVRRRHNKKFPGDLKPGLQSQSALFVTMSKQNRNIMYGHSHNEQTNCLPVLYDVDGSSVSESTCDD